MINNKAIKLSKYLTPIFQTPTEEKSEWFGYYNYDTLNYNQSFLLCNRIDVDGVSPQVGKTIELGYYEINKGLWNHIGESDSWNWQQGAMMQWLPGKGNEDSVIFNTSDGKNLVSIIHSITTNKNRVIDYPVYGLTPDGTKSISIDLERSFWCRAYHYQSVVKPEKDGRVYEEDGIFEIDLSTNKRKRIIAIQDIIAKDYRPFFDKCKHWLEHVMISPSGRRFCFLHRFSPEDNVFRYQTRLCVASIDGGDLQVIPGWESRSLSHFGWRGDDGFVIYSVKAGKISTVGSFKQVLTIRPFSLKRVMDKILVSVSGRLPYNVGHRLSGQHKCYEEYRLDEHNVSEYVGAIESNLFDIDGHPSFTSDGRYMITDSYPDRRGFQRLIVYDTKTRKGMIVARINAFYRGNPASCDLHPKLCTDNNYLAIDTAYDKNHHMMVFRIEWEKIKRVIS